MKSNNILTLAVQRILQAESLEAFGQWFVQESARDASDLAERGAGGEFYRSAIHMARMIWANTPVPSHGWRARGLPAMGRNDLCYCGSGKKFKQCCEPLSKGAKMPPGLEMRWVLINVLEGEHLQQFVATAPLDFLANCAASWNQEGNAEKSLAVLEPLFDGKRKLDDRHEFCLDELLAAYLELGMETKRLALVVRMSAHPAKDLACCAALRHVSMLSDQGDYTKAWEVLGLAKQRNPRFAPLLLSEMTLLISEGRQEEARLRAPLLAQAARKAGLIDLAQALLALGEQGFAAVGHMTGAHDDDSYIDPDTLQDQQSLRSWLAHMPEQLDAAAAKALYDLDVYPEMPSTVPGARKNAIELRKSKTLVNMDKRWRRQFAVEKPDMTQLNGDPNDCFEQAQAVEAFLRDNPQAWLNWDIVDDLLLCVADIHEETSTPTLMQDSLKLAKWAVQLLHALSDEQACQVPWAIMANRPALRCLAQAIEIAHVQHLEELAEQWLVSGLQLNPNDNHGWRELMVKRYMKTARFEEAVMLLAKYPDDMPPAQHHLALCQFAQGQRQEAEANLRQAHEDFPRFVSCLLPDVMDRPQDEGGPGLLLGGEMQAWEYRMEMRAVWHKHDGLAWLKALNLPAPPPKTAAKPSQRSRKAAADGHGSDSLSVSRSLDISKLNEIKADMKALAARSTDLPRLHGLICGVAWSPSMQMPAQWLHLLMPLLKPAAKRKGVSEIDAMNEDLSLLMELYNQLNAELIVPQAAFEPTWADICGVLGSDENRLHAWASGFMQTSELAAAAWKKSGHPVGMKSAAFAALMRLAARAAPTEANALSGAWKASQDNGQLLLVDVNQDTGTGTEELELALRSLWHTLAPLRQAQMNG